MRLFTRRRKRPQGVSTYSNESVIQRVQSDAGVDRETARAWFGEMLVFLDMVADTEHFISPPEPVDVAWHAFILHTRDYESYCRERFGRVIHHQPTGGPDPDAYRRAYGLRRSYGTVDNMIWAVPAGVAGGAAAAEAVDPGSDAGGGGFFSHLFGGGDSGGGSSGDSGGGSSGDSGGGSSCGGGGGGGGCGGGGGG